MSHGNEERDAAGDERDGNDLRRRDEAEEDAAIVVAPDLADGAGDAVEDEHPGEHVAEGAPARAHHIIEDAEDDEAGGRFVELRRVDGDAGVLREDDATAPVSYGYNFNAKNTATG